MSRFGLGCLGTPWDEVRGGSWIAVIARDRRHRRHRKTRRLPSAHGDERDREPTFDFGVPRDFSNVRPPVYKRTPCCCMTKETFSGSLDFAPMTLFTNSILHALRSR